MNTRLQRIVLVGVTAALALLMAVPFVWMISTALKTPQEVFRDPPSWLPAELRFANFVDAWQRAPTGRFFVNSLVTSLAAAVIQVAVALLMAYAFVRIRVPGRGLFFSAVIVTMLIPEELKLIPNYLLMDRLDWIDTYYALILPPAAHAFPVLVLTVQLQTIPRDFFDAAAIDGASHFRALTHVAIPSSAPMMGALFLIAFLGRWNDYLWPLVVTNSEQMRTLPVALAYLRGSQEGGIDWPLLMAMAVLIVAPILILFLVLQKRFTQGILIGGLKG